MQLSLFWPKSPDQKPLPDFNVRLNHSVFNTRLPAPAIPHFHALIKDTRLQLKVAPNRSSKSGDFRAARGKDPARITVNSNLNPYAFLITLIHEVAHFQVWQDHQKSKHLFTLRRKSRPLPHGAEWKRQFYLLMQPFLTIEIFPAVILPLLIRYLDNPKASTGADHSLARALQNYDPPDETLRLEDLPADALFTINGKRYFCKKEQLRKRYRCICMNTNRIYLVSAHAPVKLLAAEGAGRL